LVPVGTRFFVLRVDPNIFNEIRFAVCGCAALPLFAHAKPWRWPSADLVLLAVCAVLAIPGYNIPVALGARSVPAGELGVLIATEPVMIAVLTLMLQRRSVHRRIVAGSVIALFGVALTSGLLTTTHNLQLAGTLQVLAGALSWSCYTVIGARLNQRYGAFGATGAMVVVGTLALMAVSLPMTDATMLPDRGTMLLLGAMGLASNFLGFLLWNHAGKHVPPERLGLFLYVIPAASILAGAQFLDEALTMQILAGAALTVFGVWIASRGGRVVPAAIIE